MRIARCVPFHEPVVSNRSVRAWASLPSPPPSMVMAGMPRLMGTFESVEPVLHSIGIPSALVTEAAAVTA